MTQGTPARVPATTRAWTRRGLQKISGTHRILPANWKEESRKVRFWCPEWDSNPQPLSRHGTSSRCVNRFRHLGILIFTKQNAPYHKTVPYNKIQAFSRRNAASSFASSSFTLIVRVLPLLHTLSVISSPGFLLRTMA